MVKLKEHQKHIKETHADNEGFALCGARLHSFDWAFTGIDHAFYSVQDGYRMAPCPACAKRVIEIMSEET